MAETGQVAVAGAQLPVVRPLVAGWRFIRRWPVIPLVVLTALAVIGIIGPWIAPHDPVKGSIRDRQIPPAWYAKGTSKFLLGTDHAGRDMLSRIIIGARVSLMVAAVSLTSGFMVGTTIGMVSGYFGGIVDEVITRLVDIWHAIPFLMVALVMVLVFGQSLKVVLGLLAMLAWVGFVRVVRAQTLILKNMDYVALARVAGAGNVRILYRHILPGVINTAVVIATLNVGGLIVAEATLSFLGAGIPPPAPAWGILVAEGRDYVSTAWWQSVFPGAAIFLVVMSLNFLGDWMRDRFDPRLRQLVG